MLSAIRLLDVKLQDLYRFLAAKKLKQIINRDSISNVHHKRVSYIVKHIRQKLVSGNAILTQADKGRTIVIITQDAYTDKVHTFLTNNNFPTMHKDPITKYHNPIQKNSSRMQLFKNATFSSTNKKSNTSYRRNPPHRL